MLQTVVRFTLPLAILTGGTTVPGHFEGMVRAAA